MRDLVATLELLQASLTCIGACDLGIHVAALPRPAGKVSALRNGGADLPVRLPRGGGDVAQEIGLHVDLASSKRVCTSRLELIRYDAVLYNRLLSSPSVQGAMER